MKKNIKSIFLTVLAIFLIGLGYFNLGVNKDSFDISYTNNSEKTGDVELVSTEPVEEKTKEESDYFSESRLERDKMFSQMIETYQKIIDSKEISTEQKSIAIEEIDKLTNQKTGIFIAENLIKNKGFNDVVIFYNDDSISVVIKSNISLTKEQIAQIQNIVSRELNSKLENINISNK